jgi:hypothetical protein
VLGMPPAFILSQDQTLKLNSFWPKPRGKYKEQSCAQTYMFRITFYVT